MGQGEALLRVGDVVIKGERRYVVVGWTPRGKVRLKCPEAKTETTGWWPWASSLPWKRCEVWRGEERVR